jgi:ubiquitin carboxyl-terminal hydrolase L5
VYGLVFLFKWQAGLASDRPTVDSPNIFFAQQVIHNACATLAMLAILLNQNDDDLDIGDQLKNLRVCSGNLAS